MSQEDSKAGITGNISEIDGPMGTEEASPVLFTALQSFKEKLIDDGNSNFAEIDSFLLDDERNSLLNRIATLESGLAVARDRVLRIGTEPNRIERMKVVTSESGLAAARDRALRIGTESDSLEGTERASFWQMCKVMLGKACSRFFTR
jgi:tetrahydromethanopterin S-methyltransferase subunit F